MKILVKNGHVVDPANRIDGPLDILIEDERIAEVGKDLKAGSDAVIEAAGKMVLPGLVDMHVHLREPGREDKETVATGTRAGLKGGVTTVLAMPNTAPAMDSAGPLRQLKEIVRQSAAGSVLLSCALTKGRQGCELVDFAALAKEGVVAATDDGTSVEDRDIMTEALREAKRAGLLVICHCEDRKLAGEGVMNLGFMSTVLGLKGIPREAEYKRVERDLTLAAEADAPVHIAHISCRESVDLITQAKKKGLRVTAETAPHYISLDEEALMSYDTHMKMNPPLRTREDREALRQALQNGGIDVIASDHAPHTENEKEIEFDRAEFGVVGLETELSVVITELIDKGFLNWPQAIEKLALNPAKMLKIERGTLGAGRRADVIIVDPKKEWLVSKESLVSKSRNSPFLGRALKGVVEYTICGGKIAYAADTKAL